ncbi:MAG: hypothetical protein K2N26_08780 [Oscillospiraceae bacterium]|nr:hypothetical protein [Oscillospiraceae bacterium]MDE7279802.1 hypothetical protein [Oscillospiraceae bacterium]
MKSPFTFKIKMSEAKRRRRRLLMSVTAAVLLIGFTAGYMTVYINSYNILHAEPIEVFSLYRTPDGVELIFLNRLYTFSGL